MFLSQADLAAQVDRFISGFTSSLMHDVARPLSERISDCLISEGLRAHAGSWTEIRGPESITSLRGVSLWCKLKHARELAGDRVSGQVYVLDRDRMLWRVDVVLAGGVLSVDGKTSTPWAMVEECPNKTYGPLSWGHSLLLGAAGGPYKAARERVGRFERFIKYVEGYHKLDESTWDDFDVVIKWAGDPAVPEITRRVVRHRGRGSYLVHEQLVGQEPHSIREFETLSGAIDAANDGNVYLVRRHMGSSSPEAT